MTTAEDCLTLQEIQRWLCRPLTPPQRKRFYAHLATCALCRDRVHEQHVFDRLCRARVAPEPPQLAGFTVQRYLGRGCCGDAWLASCEAESRQCVLKVVRRDRLEEGYWGELLLWAELERSRPHPNRVPIRTAIEKDDRLVLVGDYLAGGPLTDQAPLPWEKAARYIADAADAVTQLSERCLVPEPYWCEITPDNLLLDAAGGTVRLDCGLSCFVDEGLFLGWSLGYAAPEVLEGWPTPRSAVFSLAATFFYLLTGEAPFCPDTRESYLDSVRVGPQDVPQRVSLPPPLADFLRRGLASDPTNRPGLTEFRDQLRCLSRQPATTPGTGSPAMASLAQELRRQTTAAHPPVNLSVTISVADPLERDFRPMLSCSSQAGGPPPEVRARTGDLIRIEASSDTDGYLTVLAFNSTGEPELLMPSQQVRDHRLPPGQNRRLTMQLTPPGGVDHTALVWTRRPVLLNAAEWGRRIRAGQVAETWVTSLGAMRGSATAGQEPATVGDDWTAVVLSVNHQDSEAPG